MITVLKGRLVDELKYTFWDWLSLENRIFGIMINNIPNILNSIIPSNNELGNSVRLSCTVVFERDLPTYGRYTADRSFVIRSY